MKVYTLILAILVLGFVSCKNSPDRPDPVLEPGYEPAPIESTTTSATAPTPTAEPAQNAEGVWHYTCPSGCEGGAGSAVPCPKCGTTLAHNSGYHNNNNNNNAAIETPTVTSSISTGNDNVTVVNGGDTPITPVGGPPEEPAQNAAGVWHYTCPSGCAGGSGSAVACASCGTTLVHNSGYHN